MVSLPMVFEKYACRIDNEGESGKLLFQSGTEGLCLNS